MELVITSSGLNQINVEKRNAPSILNEDGASVPIQPTGRTCESLHQTTSAIPGDSRRAPSPSVAGTTREPAMLGTP